MISAVPPSLDLAAILLEEDQPDLLFDEADLVPARMLNEFTYCPRLAYLEWVQGEFVDNLDTLQGTFGHRNVDKPSAKPVPAKPAVAKPASPPLKRRPGLFDDLDEPESPVAEVSENPPVDPDDLFAEPQSDQEDSPPMTTRALTLSAPREGLVAKLDVLELAGMVVTPVDYKKGSIPDNPFQAWEPERVQLCAQGLILRENGYTCEAGELYYIESRRRVVVPFDDALVMRTRQLVKQLREMARTKKIPAPLVDSPKCPRCSLVGICLPDETNLLLQLERTPEASPQGPSQTPDSTLRSGTPSPRARPLDSLFDETQPVNDSPDQSDPNSAELNPHLIPPLRASDSATCHPVISDGITSVISNSQRASDSATRNPSCDAHGLAVPDQRASDSATCHPVISDGITSVISDSQRASDSATRNPSCDAQRPAVPAVRRLLAARDDALPLYVKEQGAFVGKDGDRIVVRHREAKLVSVPLMEVSQLSLFGNVQISAQALREIADRGIPICHFSYGGWFHAITQGHVHKNIQLRIAQFAAAADPQRALALSIGFMTAKLRNSRTMLRRHGNGKTADVVGVRDLDQLAELIQKVERAGSIESLLGFEGMAAKIYFAGFARILKGGEGFDMTGRNRRPPRDPVNAVLSFVYALLTKEVTIAVQAVGFDPLLGFCHQPRYGRPSLALDLAEEFRPIIADSTAMMVINNGEVGPSSFLSRAGAVALTEAGRRSVIAAFERRMDQEITHPIFGYKLSYRRVLEVQARLLSRVVMGELPMYPGFCTR